MKKACEDFSAVYGKRMRLGRDPSNIFHLRKDNKHDNSNGETSHNPDKILDLFATGTSFIWRPKTKLTNFLPSNPTSCSNFFDVCPTRQRGQMGSPTIS